MIATAATQDVPAVSATTLEQTEEILKQSFANHVLPLIQSNCLDCHDAATKEAELDLSGYKTLESIITHYQVWEIVLERVEAGEMPPADAGYSLTDDQRSSIVDWIKAFRTSEAEKHAGDPGPVLTRRLSNSEYDYSIRDLTGVDIRPTSTFPVDPANEAGFDNSGESLTMSPALMNKYLEASRKVSEHLVLTPFGIEFAPHPAVTDTDRDKYCVKRIVEFYQQQPTDYADYFYAAWLFKHCQSLRTTKPSSTQTLASTAQHLNISPKYLELLWQVLNDENVAEGPLKHVQESWSQLPEPGLNEDNSTVQAACQQLSRYVRRARKYFEFTVENLDVPGVHSGSQCFVLWKNRRYASLRRSANMTEVQHLAVDDQQAKNLPRLLPPSGDSYSKYVDDCRTFCSVFPDAFYISERGRDYLGQPREKQEKGRLLSAGFHSMMGYFRDDQPLCDLLLNEKQQAELDRLWRELDFVTSAPMRQYQGFLWFERTDSRFMRDPEFDFARPEDLAALNQDLIQALGEVYRTKAIANGAMGDSLTAIDEYFSNINAQIRWVEQARQAAEPKHIEAIIEFAGRAFRRPLSDAEKGELREFYRYLREEDDLQHGEAIQDLLVAILMSPSFLYRVDLLANTPNVEPLNNFELATRLSYFLWSSLPDEPLLTAAASGKLAEPEELDKQLRRMLADAKSRGLAVEFAGNWLDFRRFEEHNSVDRNRFPQFDDELRRAMFEEPVRFFSDVMQNDRSILDFLYADHTFANKVLATHYGFETSKFDSADQWQEFQNIANQGRGGLLAMSVFLTKNAPGLRTSPVKRGYWVVRRILGERIPAPPPNVPELPSDEAKMGERTLRETLALHREHPSCSGCHNRIDSIGLVFESYGPIGERRELDLGGRTVDDRATFPDGSEGTGLEALRNYIALNRESDFVDNLCRKMLSYALGRTLILSDELLIQQMKESLVANDYRFSSLVSEIVLSPQFLNKRGSH